MISAAEASEAAEETGSHGATEPRRRTAGDCTASQGSAVITPVTALRAVWIEQRPAHKTLHRSALGL